MSRPLALIAVLALSACASRGGVAPGAAVAMPVEARASLPDGGVLHYLGIANDSRCPAHVQCIHAGDADVLFDFSPPQAAPARIVLNTAGSRAADIGAWRLHLLELAPGAVPAATIRIDARRPGSAP